MDTDITSTAFLVDMLRAGRINKMFELAGSVVFLYDYLLTLGMEVEYVWPGPWTAVKVVYFIQRYLPFIDTLLLELYIDLGENLSPGACTRLTIASRTFLGLGLATSEVLLTFRVWAVWNQPRALTIALPILFAGCFLPSLPISFIFYKSLKYIGLPPPFLSCVPFSGSSIVTVLWVLLLVWDFFILVLMAISALRSYRIGANSALYHAVYADGIIYYICLVITSIVNTLLVSQSSVKGPYHYIVTTLSRCLHSILASRALLHIRAADRKDGQTEDLEQVSLGNPAFRKALRRIKNPQKV